MYVDPSGHAAAYLTDLAKATNGTAKWDSEKKVAVVTVNGVTQTFKLSANSVVNGKIVIDNEKFDSLFTKTSGNSLITVDTTVKNGKITATQTVKSGTYTVAQASLAGQTNNYYKDTHNPTSGNNANKANSTVNKGTGNSNATSSSKLKTGIDYAVNILQGFSAGFFETITYGVSGNLDKYNYRTNEKVYVISKIAGNAVAGAGGSAEVIGGVVISAGTGGIGAVLGGGAMVVQGGAIVVSSYVNAAQNTAILMANTGEEGISDTQGASKTVKPEAAVTGSKKHGVNWKEGPARANKTGNPQGQWDKADIDFATQKANTLEPGKSDYFDLPEGSKSIVHMPDGTTVPATKIWVRNNGTGTWHGYPMP